MRSRPLVPVALLALAGLLLAACGGAEEPTDANGPEQVVPDDTDEAGSDDGAPDGDEAAGEGGEAPADLERFTDLAIATAADETGVAEEEIEVVRAEEVTWRDGALGCPAEGEMYTQALVPGYRVVLETNGEQRHYHGGEGKPPFHCEDPQEPAEE